MTKTIPSLQHRVQELMPEIRIDQFEINQEGLVNDVVIVNRSLVFRFAKNETAVKILADEMNILDLVQQRVDLDVPTPLLRRPDSIVYPFLEGQPFLREAFLQLNPKTQSCTARQLGKFLYAMHTTPIARLEGKLPVTRAPVTRARWEDIRRRTTEKIYPLLLKHQKQWAERLFDGMLSDPEGFNYTPALIHGDLAPYHILFDGKALTGVIDFGVAGVGDPALDLGTLLGVYGESFVRQMAPEYPGMDLFMPRARFYAQAVEIQWVLLGLETGDSFWFTAHLGGARDIE